MSRPALPNELVLKMVEMRKSGMTIEEVAFELNVCTLTVSRKTKPYGPFPANNEKKGRTKNERNR